MSADDITVYLRLLAVGIKHIPTFWKLAKLGQSPKAKNTEPNGCTELMPRFVISQRWIMANRNEWLANQAEVFASGFVSISAPLSH